MWNILEAVLKKICWQFSRKWVLEKRLLFVFSFVFACLGRRSFTRVMRLVCTCICHRTFCICICICLYLFDFACLGSGSVGKVMSLVCCHRHDRHTQVYPERNHKKSQKNGNMDLANLFFCMDKNGYTHSQPASNLFLADFTQIICKYNDFCLFFSQNVEKRWTWACRCCRTQRRQAGQRCTAASPWTCRTMTCETSSYWAKRFNLWN